MTIKFETALLKVLANFWKTNRAFSAHDITVALREQVNSGELALSGEYLEDVDGVNTYRIEHPRVREFISELWSEGLLSKFCHRDVQNGHYVYWNKYSISHQSQPVVPSCNCTQAQPVSNEDNSIVVSSAVKHMIVNYIENKFNKGETPTLKSIQSRMKGTKLTVDEIAKIVSANGYAIQPCEVFSLSVVS